MITNLQKEFISMLDQNDWMDIESKKKAEEKVKSD